MGGGLGLGIAPEIIAGAVISGSIFGDKMSPLSDSTNLASGVAQADLFDHIKEHDFLHRSDDFADPRHLFCLRADLLRGYRDG